MTQRRFFRGGSLLLSGRVIHLDGDNLIIGTGFQWPTRAASLSWSAPWTIMPAMPAAHSYARGAIAIQRTNWASGLWRRPHAIAAAALSIPRCRPLSVQILPFGWGLDSF